LHQNSTLRLVDIAVSADFMILECGAHKIDCSEGCTKSHFVHVIPCSEEKRVTEEPSVNMLH
ncbi:unnamed protein product, partial [Ceratitis capitata]